MADDDVVAALRAEHRQFFDYEHRRIRDEIATHEACPACGSTSSRREFSKDWFTVDRCRECGMGWTNPRLNDETLANFYNGRYTAAYNETKFFNQTQRQADIVSADARHFLTRAAPYQPSGRFLEIGPGGEGTMMAAAIAAGYDVTGVELTTDCVDALRRRFGDAATVIHSDLEHAGFEPGSFNVVAMRDVLEHIPHPKRFLRNLWDATAEGAVLLIQVPNIDGLIYRLVRERHTVIFGFEHVNYWTVGSLRRALAETGFEMVEVEHQTSDFTLASMHSYFFGPSTFTTVFRRPPPSAVVRGVGWVTWQLIRVLKPADRLLPKLANRLGRGSVITVVARRRATQSGQPASTSASDIRAQRGP